MTHEPSASGRFNLCCSGTVFEDPRWRAIFDEFHSGLKKPDLPSFPIPSMHDFYWNELWRHDPSSAYREFASPANLKQTHKIWEYVQILYNLTGLLPTRRGGRILSLGSGIESPLWFLSRRGFDVTATDIYFERKYWHPEYVPHLRNDPSVFCPYEECRSVRFENLNLRIRDLSGLIAWNRLGLYDAIYSISSVEHVYGVQRTSGRDPDGAILVKKIGLFKRISRHLMRGGVLTFTTELVTRFDGIRRLDFYTQKEIGFIIEGLEKMGLDLQGPVDWQALTEQELATRGIPGHFHTALSLAFIKR